MVDSRSTGLHLAIIPDGNRRWARERSLKPWNGHETAIENFRTLTEWCRTDPRIGILTVWCFSTENWKRERAEIEALFRMYEEYLRKERAGFRERKTRFLHTGRLDRIPESLATLINEVQEETNDEREFTLNLAVDYGGKDEIIRAAERARSAGTGSLTEETFRTFLDHPELPDIDLVLRTSGERRTSNFFLWQSAYAEWIFLEKYFPDVTTDDLAAAVADYERRTRRFGN
jgi:undecaprenyl diphosphate synthase